ncbi:MAG: LOG family protein [Candidatus Hydrogenedentes bacterium]|nr:LOG family protein [Candidatus Hydrogenedentota bacterium]
MKETLTPPDKWPEKSYKNPNFLNSGDARLIRVMCEFIEPESRLRRAGVRNTVVFFGSARTLPRDIAEANVKAARAQLNTVPEADREARDAYDKAQRDLKMARYYEDAASLAEKLTTWSLSLGNKSRRFYVCSGGGSGIMEAANRGAHRAGGTSVSFNISLPMEQAPNGYQTRELAFEFHYFFVRKFWFFYLAKALVVFPGGYGTMDELFELLTLVQTEKTIKYMPILVYGTEYWREIVDFEALAKWGVIDRANLDLFRFFDDVDEAFGYLKAELTKHYV